MSPNRKDPSAFTLIELLASMAILGLIMVMLFSAFDQINRAWLQGQSRVETFTQARAALDFMSREISQTIVSDKIPFYAKEIVMTINATNPTNLPLGNLAFIASAGDTTPDEMDLMEIVYRVSRQRLGIAEGTGPGPYFFTNADPGPYKLIRRAAGFSGTQANCRDYGSFSDPNTFPWDFYTSPLTWPQTSDRTKTAVLAEDIISLQFQFQDAAAVPNTYNYWNSTANVTAWQQELDGVAVPAAVPNMRSRPPSLVIITIVMLDSRSAGRYSTANPDTKKQILLESGRVFTTSVAIPNRLP